MYHRKYSRIVSICTAAAIAMTSAMPVAAEEMSEFDVSGAYEEAGSGSDYAAAEEPAWATGEGTSTGEGEASGSVSGDAAPWEQTGSPDEQTQSDVVAQPPAQPEDTQSIDTDLPPWEQNEEASADQTGGVQSGVPESAYADQTVGTGTVTGTGEIAGTDEQTQETEETGTLTPDTVYGSGSISSTWRDTHTTWLAGLSGYEKLLVGMKQTGKRYAIANEAIPIYMKKVNSESDKIAVGTLQSGGLCFVIADTGDGWVFVESGEVRGFTKTEWLTTGVDAETQVSDYGENNLALAEPVMDAEKNEAFRYALVTVYEVPQQPYSYSYLSAAGLGGVTATTSAGRTSIITYAKQFLGRPYVWGGNDLWNGVDCSGFIQQVYAHFGVSLPRTTYEQCYSGTRITLSEAQPGDIIFYASQGVVYHAMLYLGNGKVIHAQSANTGIVISDLNVNEVCWGVRVFTGDDKGTAESTQVKGLSATGKLAYEGDSAAQKVIIEAIAEATAGEWQTYGLARSVLIAQVIQESGWLSLESETDGGIQEEDNNVLSMNAELLNDRWVSPWTGQSAKRAVPSLDANGNVTYKDESMRVYEDIESCIADYAAFKVSLHPQLKGEKDVDVVLDTVIRGYADDKEYRSAIISLINTFDLTKYDVTEEADFTAGYSSDMGTTTGATDGRMYTKEQLELIWAIVAQEDNGSYEGALAVITSAMNRADANYGGHGQDALSQLTADGQYCYSPSVSDPIYYQQRLGGNVPDYVKQAVSDCLTRGLRNHRFQNFRSRDGGGWAKIGGNYFF